MTKPGETACLLYTSDAADEMCIRDRYITVEDRRIHCHKRTGHGSETFVQGIQNSCNPVFIDLGLRIGSERYYADFKRFGLLDKTGVDLPQQ